MSWVAILSCALGAMLFTLGAGNLLRVLTRRHWPHTVGIVQWAVPTEPQNLREWFDQVVLGRAALGRAAPGRAAPDLTDQSQAGQAAEISSAEPAQQLCYVYALEGFKYIGAQMQSAPVWPVGGNRLADVQPGDKVHVFYHPKFPHRAFLVQSFAWPMLVQLLTGIGICAVAVAVAVVFS
ncbi:DUF3592 domain-containing protein [Simiduia sp. 21SJ11W-1]|uniref:DUF3592 domain-containing protein n=1 Tax=Simiduia sp. 21SJ11W-1 TaxID=2909669 RepID=UPI003531F982